MKPAAGFQEHATTADWELEVWAPELPGLWEQSARGMYALSGMQLKSWVPQDRSIALQGEDAETLLVRFLTELLWYVQEEWLGFDRFSIAVDNRFNLQADLQGKAIANLDKEIKAVTYHNLEVVSTSQGLSATIVF